MQSPQSLKFRPIELGRHPDCRPVRRGTAIILVVACLTLLAVLGTAFIVMARMERGSAESSTDAVNMDFAQDAFLNHVRDVIYSASVTPSTTPVSPDTAPNVVLGDVKAWGPNEAYGVGAMVYAADGRAYISNSVQTSDCGSDASGPPGVSTSTDWTLYDITSNAIIRSRFYDYPDPGIVTGTGGPFISTNDSSMVAEPWLTAATDTDSVSSGTTDFTLLETKRFDPSTGAYDIFNPTVKEVTAVDPLITTPNLDSVWDLSTFTSASGVRYRCGLRIIDTSRFANLNTGDPSTTPDPISGAYTQSVPDTNGQYLTGLWLASPSLVANPSASNPTDTTPSNLQKMNGGTGVLGRSPGNAFALGTWQAAIMGYEVPTSATQLFDLSDELELRAYDFEGTDYEPRPASAGMFYYSLMGAQTAANLNHGAVGIVQLYASYKPTPTTPLGNSGRNLFTTYSFDRNLSSVGQHGSTAANTTAPFTFTPTTPAGAAAISWPGDFKQIPLTASTVSGATAFAPIAYAAYLANAMASAGFSEDEALSVAVNYLGQSASNSMIVTVPANGSVPAHAIAHATVIPPVILGGTTSLIEIPDPTNPTEANIAYYQGATSSGVPRSYFAYRAQPFLSEVAAHYDALKNMDDFAIELFNPYLSPSGAINLDGWRIRINGDVQVADLGATLFSATGDIPGSTFAVVQLGSQLTVVGTKATYTAASGNPPPESGTVTLERPYLAGTGVQYEVVDKFTYTFTPTASATQDVQRADLGTNSTGNSANFACDSPSYTNDTATTPTLGKVNSNSAADNTIPGLLLPDAFATTTSYTPSIYPVNGSMSDNINDLQNYMRICPHTTAGQTDASTASYMVTMCDQLTNKTVSTDDTAVLWADLSDTTLPSAMQATVPQERKFHLDYRIDPRAQKLLTLVATVDRASDGVDEIGAGTADTLAEVRLPGRVNINTASPQVLQAMPLISQYQPNAGTANAANYANLPADIIAYRTRTGPYTSYPGLGFRSLAELMIPVNAALGTTGVTDLPSRDANWAKMFTLSTVRSDTFCVYGYLEAVRPNPLYTGFNNGTPEVVSGGTVTSPGSSDWYDSNSSQITDDPTTTSTTIPLIRVAKRRFVAILDRSWCDYARTDTTGKFILPKIVALRELPQ